MKKETLKERLCGFSDSQLKAELRRREHGDEDDIFYNTQVSFCEDCRHFSYGGTESKPEGKCARAKTMKFRIPPGPHDDYGHYRIGCEARENLPAAVAAVIDPGDAGEAPAHQAGFPGWQHARDHFPDADC